MSIKSRVKKLEHKIDPPEPTAPPPDAEDIAAAQRIIDRAYADPVRYADRIKLFEQAGWRQPKAEERR